MANKNAIGLDDFSQKIEQEIEQKLQGDAALTNNAMADQRVLSCNNPNYYFVRKQDFNSPNLYNLNILKPYGRSKIRTFLDN